MQPHRQDQFLGEMRPEVLTMSTPIGKQAAVVGAGMGGLTAAAALADYFEHVTVLERDALPPEAAHRAAGAVKRPGSECCDQKRLEASTPRRREVAQATIASARNVEPGRDRPVCLQVVAGPGNAL